MKNLNLLIITLLFLGQITFAGEKDSGKPTVDEIVRKANMVSYYQGADGRAEIEMQIFDKDGKMRSREFVVLRRDDVKEGESANSDDYCEGQKFYIYFQRPADWNKTSFMVHKYIDRDDDRWLYLPGLDLVKRIAASDKRTSFVGSNFFYEDISGRNLSEDVHELAGENETTYIIKNTPKKPEQVEFSYYNVYVHKKTFLPYATEYFDKEGKKYRMGKALATEVIDGYVTVTKSEMADLRTGGKTVLNYSKIKYNIALPEDIFTERYLRNPPRKYLR